MDRDDLLYHVRTGQIDVTDLEFVLEQAKNDNVRFPHRTVVTAYTNKDNMWDQFRSEGFTDDEIRNWGLQYIGGGVDLIYEIHKNGEIKFIGVKGEH